ncbi:AAA domain-containing protein [Caenispirillum salinarum]|uniref:AAA domain-containing protein n=1 Tax=Caenispirillum salinarum TaxID=859058 RepID=UPI00384CD953
MQVTYANAQGIHAREIKGVQALKEKLPGDWYAFANLEVIQPGQKGRQVDIAIVMDDRIMLADIKDWNGTIGSDGAYWSQNGRSPEASPVHKIADNARLVAGLLRGHLKKLTRSKGDRIDLPFIDSCVILTGRSRFEDEFDEGQRSRVFHIDEFCRVTSDPRERYKRFLQPKWIDKTNPLLAKDSPWRQRLQSFFVGRNGQFRAQEMTFGGHRVTSDVVYAHPDRVYVEHECVEINSDRSSGLLRLWDFGKAPVKFVSEEYRHDIAGREQRVLAHLADRNPELERFSLRPKTAEPDTGVRYWEIFEKRKQLRRLGDFVSADLGRHRREERIDVLRILLSHAADLHRMGAAHLDLGEHSVWVEMPATIRLSHFLCAHYGENRSIAEDRYAFLGNRTVLPEDVLGSRTDHFRRDVFLLGKIAHLLLFGTAAKGSDGEPPEWEPGADAGGEYEELHDWFARALDTDPESRFTDAEAMLAAFNASLGDRPDVGALIERLQRYRTWKSILQVYQAYPPAGEALKDDDRVLVYVSGTEGNRVLVKFWKSFNWQDERTDAARLLEFCERAELLSLQSGRAVAQVRSVAYLGDHLLVVSDHVGDETLAQTVPESVPSVDGALTFVDELIDAVDDLHALGFAHGDLSPSNIVVKRDEKGEFHPILIDVLEFGADRSNPAYAPSRSCGSLERDRFAVLKIAEELLAAAPSTRAAAPAVAEAIEVCRSSHPPLSTLQPLKDAIAVALHPAAEEAAPHVRVGLMSADAAGLMLADEGRYYVRVHGGAEPKVSVFGADSELLVFLDRDGRPRRAVLRRVDQSKVATAARRHDATVRCTIDIENVPQWNFRDFDRILSNEAVRIALGAAAPEDVDESDEEELDAPPAADGTVEEDQGIGEGEGSVADEELDVPLLWRTLIDIETEFYTEVEVDADSHYAREADRHLVSYSPARGTLDFDRNDKVEVRMPHPRRDEWIRLGRLDVDRTNGRQLAIDDSFSDSRRRGPLCRAGTRLRFDSLFELEGRNRRDRATSRILGHRSVIRDLVDYFDPAAEPEVRSFGPAPDVDHLMGFYGLNRSQAESFVELWTTGPVGLLQGPPGTGKTTFIAAFIHYALTEGRMRNVLLASQSHEAVNNAAEDIMRLFGAHGGMPSLVRVGQQGVVSDPLMPFHSAHVETLYRERFKARLRENVTFAGERLSLPEAFIEKFFRAATALRPVIRQIHNLTVETADRRDTVDGNAARLASLAATAEQMIETIGLPEIDVRSGLEEEELFAALVERLADDFGVTNRENVRRLLMIMRLSDDWLGHVGTRRRNFEQFLVGTRQIVCGTCVGLGRSSLGLSDAVFDLVVIDEAARCAPGELAVPLQSAKRALLVGDHLQLEPFHDRNVIAASAKRLGVNDETIRESDFKRAFASGHGRSNGRTLEVQYRMLEPIGAMVSKVFYEPAVRLEHGRETPKLPVGIAPGPLDLPVTWYDTSGLGRTGHQSPLGARRKTLCNRVEADVIVQLLTDLEADQAFEEWLSHHAADGEPPIGVICGYSGQKELLSRKIAASGLTPRFLERVKIDTVDSYQGKQNLIVILSLVRNNADGSHGTIRQGFMSRPNRINVALSRAMDRLVIVGARTGWPEDGPMAAVSAAVASLAAEGNARIVTVGSTTGEGK